MEKVNPDEPHIFASNHVSWFDVPSLAKVLPRNKFIAKSELFKVPIFGRAMRAVSFDERVASQKAIAKYKECFSKDLCRRHAGY